MADNPQVAGKPGVAGSLRSTCADITRDAERPASTRPASLCPECDRGWGEDHDEDCVLRSAIKYVDYLRYKQANDPESYWGRYTEYLTDE